MKILLLGKDGQVGWELQRSLAPLGELIAIGRQQANFEQPENLRTVVRQIRPDVIVNSAAYTAVDKAESEPEKARRVNAESVGVLAEEAHRFNAWLVHYSTDYVFNGEKAEPYKEEDGTAPLSVYGKTKLEGEQRIRNHNPKHLIFRISWVYAARGGNFAKTILRLAQERDELNIIADQYGAPTSAELIADVTALALYRIHQKSEFGQGCAGTYHLAASGYTTWYDYAKYVLELAWTGGAALKLHPDAIKPITTDEYPLPAARPKNSRLETTKLTNMFNVHLPDWRFHMRRLMSELST